MESRDEILLHFLTKLFQQSTEKIDNHQRINIIKIEMFFQPWKVANDIYLGYVNPQKVL